MSRASASIILRALPLLVLTSPLASAQGIEMTLASRSSSGTDAANAASNAITMTPDGRFVLFNSQATNLVAGQTDTPSTTDVFVFDRQTATTTLVSRAAGSATTTANNSSTGRAISNDGRYVVWQTLATNPVVGVTDTNAAADVYLFDRQTGAQRLLSHTSTSLLETANNASVAFNEIAIDPNGAFAVFQSLASNLVSGVIDNNGVEDVFLFNIQDGVRTLVSRAASQPVTTGSGQSLPLQVTPGATFVLFFSSAANLVSGVADTNGTFDAFLYDRLAGTTTLITTAAGVPAQTADGIVNQAVMTPDARFIVVNTRATNMVSGQTDIGNTDDVFLIDRQTGARRLLSGVNGSLTQTMGATQTMSRRQLSADGRYIVISTQGTNLVSGVTDSNAANDLYLFDRLADTTVLLSGANGSTTQTANGLTGAARLSGDGLWLIVGTQATNFESGVTDLNAGNDVFLIDTGSRLRTLLSAQAGAPSTTANAATMSIVASADGTTHLLDSTATNLVAGIGDANVANDVFVARRPHLLLRNGFEND